MAGIHDNQPRIAVIGCGHWGRNHVRNQQELGSLQMVCDSTAEGRKLAAELAPDAKIADSFEAALSPEVQGVILATPAPTHFELACRALEAGKDVLVEKPMALNAAEGRKMVELAARHGRILIAGHILEYHPGFLKLVELVRSGELGELRYLYSNRLGPGKVRQQENVLWSLAPHDVSCILRITGCRPDMVLAQAGAWVQPGIPDAATVQMSFPKDVKANIFVSWIHPFRERRVVVVGSEGSAMFDDVTAEVWHYPLQFVPSEGQVLSRAADPIKLDFPPTEALRNESLAFLEAIRTRRSPTSDGASALLTLEVLEQAQRSMAGQKA
jgi:predicted dehydrogenase